jgi:hypothetical protein
LGEFIIVEQRAGRIGHDELVRFFAVAHGESIVLVVLHEPDDLELQLLSVGRLDDEDIPKFEQAILGGACVMVMAVG